MNLPKPSTGVGRLAPPGNLPGVFGAALLVASLVTFLFLMLSELGTGQVSPYVGLLNYVLLPVLGALGAVLWWVGVRLRRRRGALAADSPGEPSRFDFRKIRTQQHLLLLTGGLAAGLIFLMSLGGVRAVEYTESEVFCGEVCHTVMEPEYVAYRHDAHAQVACVDCHVGEGAGAFVRAKINGMHQVWSVATGGYPRPIPAPVQDIREPSDTCEQCHWPDRDLGTMPLSREYHLTEGFDRPWSLEMSVFVGGGASETGYGGGAHWHTRADQRVEYVALDRQRQQIALVRFTSTDGATIEFRNRDLEFSEDDLASGETLETDCLTCHNRPAHRFPVPVVALNRELRLGRLDAQMPALRPSVLELMGAGYASQDEALRAIAEVLPVAVAEEDSGWAAAHPGEIERAVEVLQGLFARSRFPYMRADWQAYPDNLGHWFSDGCFRCHAGNMVSAEGDSVSSECSTCHLIRGQGRVGESWRYDPAGLDFVHPPDNEVMAGPVLCSECHDGVLGY